jgi:hypothetical protein
MAATHAQGDSGARKAPVDTALGGVPGKLSVDNRTIVGFRNQALFGEVRLFLATV